VSFIAPVLLVHRCNRWAGANPAARGTTRHPSMAPAPSGPHHRSRAPRANTGDRGQAPSRPRWAVHRRSSQPARTRIHLSNSYHDEFHVARRADQGRHGRVRELPRQPRGAAPPTVGIRSNASHCPPVQRPSGAHLSQAEVAQAVGDHGRSARRAGQPRGSHPGLGRGGHNRVKASSGQKGNSEERESGQSGERFLQP